MTTETLLCNEARQKIVALLDGELSSEDRAILRRHLSTCAACAAASVDFAAVRGAAEAWQIADDADLTARFEERLITKSHGVYTPLPGPTFRMTIADYENALSLQKAEGGDLGDILLRKGLASEVEIYRARALAEHLPFIDLQKHKPEPSATVTIPAWMARQHLLIPVKRDGSRLWVAMKNPQDTEALDALRTASRFIIMPMAAVPSHLEDALNNAYGEADAPPPETAVREDDSLIAALKDLRGEITAMRDEIHSLRKEIVGLRQQVSAARPPATATLRGNFREVSYPHLMPYAPPSDSPSLLG